MKPRTHRMRQILLIHPLPQGIPPWVKELKGLGSRVTTARDIPTALAALEGPPPGGFDLLLVDLHWSDSEVQALAGAIQRHAPRAHLLGFSPLLLEGILSWPTRLSQVQHRIRAFREAETPEPDAAHSALRGQAVRVLQQALSTWSEATGSTRLQLAQESQIWHVYNDGTGLRCRQLDRYLKLDSLPQKPRWHQIIETARYVIARTPSLQLRLSLEGELKHLEFLLEYASDREEAPRPHHSSH